LLALTGTDDTNFTIIRLSQNCGVSSQESVAIYRDTAYFLWQDGVYSWDDSGIQCLSDGRVRSWFATDDYFNRSRFQYAFGHVDPIRNKYRLFLNIADSTTALSWVEYDLNAKTWWGPHRTSAYTPTSVFNVIDGELVQRPTFGSSAGNVYREQETRTDATAIPIDMDVVMKRFDMKVPDLDKFWGQLSVIGKVQTAGLLDVGLSVGELDAPQTDLVQWDMTSSRERLTRVGSGKHVQLELMNSETGQDAEVFGLEISPVHILGRR
jgi:hypothetical protein